MKKLLTATCLSALMASAAHAETLTLVEVITSPARTETLESIVARFEEANPGTDVEIISLPSPRNFRPRAPLYSPTTLYEREPHG